MIHISGATLNFGDMNGDSSSGFSGSMELSERFQNRHDIIKSVWDFLETTPFERMKPRQDLVSNGYCLAAPGHDYIVYLESGGNVDVRIEGGPFRVEWINAQNPSDRRDCSQVKP